MMNNPYFIGLGLAQIFCGSITIATQVSNFFYVLFTFLQCGPSMTAQKEGLLNHRLENRSVLRNISNMNFLFWAVLGSRGLQREKKVQTAISMQLLRPVFFYVFMNRD